MVLTMFDGRTQLANDVVKEVRRYFGEPVFKSVIPRSIRLAEAPSYGQPISVYAPSLRRRAGLRRSGARSADRRWDSYPGRSDYSF